MDKARDEPGTTLFSSTLRRWFQGPGQQIGVQIPSRVERYAHSECVEETWRHAAAMKRGGEGVEGQWIRAVELGLRRRADQFLDAGRQFFVKRRCWHKSVDHAGV